MRKTTSDGRVLRRGLNLVNRPPGPIRDLRFADGVISWKPPKSTLGLTHYRVYVGNEFNLARQVPADQTQIADNLTGDRIFVSAYNENQKLESPKIGYANAVAPVGQLPPGLGYLWNITIDSVEVSLSDPTDFGIRFVVVKINYYAPVPKGDFTKVRLFTTTAEEPEPRPRGDSICPDFAATAVLVVDPPAEAYDLTVWLASSSASYDVPLVTDSGLMQTPHVTVTINPVAAGSEGAEWADNVTGFALLGSPQVTGFYDSNGVYKQRVRPTWTKPADTRWGGVEFILYDGTIYTNLGRYVEPPDYLVFDCPPSSKSGTLYARSFDQRGKVNSIHSSTPKVTFTFGDASGKLDLGKALTTSVGSALSVVNNVLGVPQNGITEELIAQFAVSQAKLANSPIIDTARIEDAAVTTAKIANLAVTNALIANAAITQAKIGNAQIVNAHIADATIESGKIKDLAVDKITSWSGKTISIGAGISFSNGFYSTIINGDKVTSKYGDFGDAVTTPLLSAYQISGPVSGPLAISAADGVTVNGTQVSLAGHTHDSRYYTESEVDTLLSGKAASSHGHSSLGADLSVSGVVTATGFKVGDNTGIDGEVQFKDHSGNNKSMWFNKGILFAITG